MVLGGGDADGTGAALAGLDQKRDGALGALYDSERKGGLGGSSPRVARWLGDIRTYFPSSVVQVMQRDAIDRLGLRKLLLEPEVLESVQPDVHLVASLLALKAAIPERSRETARAVVRRVVNQLEDRLGLKTRQTVAGAIDRASRTRRPRPGDIDWNRTILANLKRYQPAHRTVIPEVLIGYGRRAPRVLRDVIVCVDQSGSMAASVVYASVFAAVLASVRSLHTTIVVFDTEVVDLSEHLSDPVDILFGVQLGGGTDINRAVAYCEQQIRQPRDTVLVLLTDLHEGGDADELLARAAALHADGVVLIVLLALSDDGAPSYDHELAADLATMGIPVFACTPDQFPDLMAAAIERRDIAAWAATNRIVLAHPIET